MVAIMRYCLVRLTKAEKTMLPQMPAMVIAITTLEMTADGLG